MTKLNCKVASSFPREALLTTLRVCVRIWDGVGFGVRVSEIKATNLVNIIGGFLKKKWLGLGVIRTIVC